MSTKKKLAIVLFILTVLACWAARGRLVTASASFAILGQGPTSNAQWLRQQLQSSELSEGLAGYCESQHPEHEAALKEAAYQLQSEHRLQADISGPNTLELSIRAASPQQALWLCQACEKWLRQRLQAESVKLPPELLETMADREARLQECEVRLQASRLPGSFAELRYQEAYAKLRSAREQEQAWLDKACREKPALITLSPPQVRD